MKTIKGFDEFIVELSRIVEQSERVKEELVEVLYLNSAVLRDQDLLQRELQICSQQRDINYQLGYLEIAIDEEIRYANLEVAKIEVDGDLTLIIAGLRRLDLETSCLKCKLYQLLSDAGCTRVIRQIREADDPILAAKDHFSQ